MSTESPVRVLLLVSNAQLRARATTALEDGNFLFDTNLEGAACGDAWQVLVTDRCVEERFVRERAGRENCAVVGIAVAENVDVQLPEDFTGRELRIAVQLVSQIAALRAERNQLAEAHSAVRELAETDPLTGLPNRRAWERQVPALLAQSQRTGEPAWLALIDLDGFKQINDQLGHNVGSRLLVRLADALNQLHVLLPVLDESKHYWQGPDEVDKLLLAARVETDRTKRYQMYAEAEQLIMDDAVVIPTFWPVDHVVVKPCVHGYPDVSMTVPKYRFVEIKAE